MVRNKSSLLIDEPPLQVLPTLAIAIGLNEAIFSQQLHWLLLQFGKSVKGQEGRWVYNTITEWREKFPFWSERTIKRIIKDLKTKGILRVGRFNKMAIDQTRWYSIDYEKLNSYSPIVTTCPDGQGQNVTMTLGQNDPMIPKSKNTYQREKDGQDATPAPERPAPPPLKEVHPFVTAYRDTFRLSLNRAQISELECLSADAANVERWREVLRIWALNGWGPRNLIGMIDRFRKEVQTPAAASLTRTRDGIEQIKIGGKWYPRTAPQEAI